MTVTVPRVLTHSLDSIVCRLSSDDWLSPSICSKSGSHQGLDITEAEVVDRCLLRLLVGTVFTLVLFLHSQISVSKRSSITKYVVRAGQRPVHADFVGSWSVQLQVIRCVRKRSNALHRTH